MPKSGKLNKLSETEKAYLAGLIDADGSVGIYRTKSDSKAYKFKYGVRVLIVNCDFEIISWIKEKTGIGCAHKTGIRYKINWRQCHRWQVTTNQARMFLMEIMPYLRIKKQRAELSVSIPHQGHLGKQRSKKDYDRQEYLFYKLKELNKRGI